jgi:hypothetical protein
MFRYNKLQTYQKHLQIIFQLMSFITIITQEIHHKTYNGTTIQNSL